MAASARGALLVSALTATALLTPGLSAYAAPVPATGTTPAQTWAQLEKQVRSTAPATAGLRQAAVGQQATEVLRCFQLQQENYCLGLGFVDKAPADAELAAAATPLATAAAATPTGAMTTTAFVAQRAAMTDTARTDAELAEMRTAWEGREKARSLRQDVQPAPAATPATYYIMGSYPTSQERSYWCGPATFQSIDWADDKQKDTQLSWASDLGTTTSGTAITSMVSQTNIKTNWDVAAGAYITQSVSSWTWQKFFTVHQNHLGDGTPAPIIEHPQLLRAYFPYLRYNHSGHFQVGRGYSRNTTTITIFEVYNERRFNSTGNVTNGTKNIPASKMFSATLANQFKNVGL